MKLRVLTYNIHKCIGGLDRRCDLPRVARAIRHYAPDVVLLQEVDAHAPRSRHERQAEALGARLGLRHRAFFSNVKLRGGGEYGNAVLSRFPIASAANIDLTVPFKKRRGALHARLRVRPAFGGARTLHVYNLHLGLSGIERKVQLRRFLSSHPFAGLHHRAPILLGGDFNDVWGTLGPKLLEPVGFKTWPHRLFTFPAIAPVRALDGLYVRGDVRFLQLERSRLEVARAASDHLPLIADLELT